MLVLLLGHVGQMMTPQPWPEIFYSAFLENVTWSPGNDFSAALHGELWYGWAFNKSQRIEHGAGSTECVKFYNTHKPCTLMTKPEGLYRILEDPAAGEPSCCLDMPSITTPPPHWVMAGKPTWGGIVTIQREDASPLGWKGLTYRYPQTGNCSKIDQPVGTTRTARNSGCHSYLQTTDDERWDTRPLLFTFPSGDGSQDWHFQPETMAGTSKVDAAKFVLPAGCANTKCAKTSAGLRADAPSWPAAYWA